MPHGVFEWVILIISVPMWVLMSVAAFIYLGMAYLEIKDWIWRKLTYLVHKREAESQKSLDSLMGKRSHGERTIFAERTFDSVSKKAPLPLYKSQTHSRPDRARLTTTTSMDFANMDLPTALEQLRSERKDSARRLEMTQALETHWNNTGVK